MVTILCVYVCVEFVRMHVVSEPQTSLSLTLAYWHMCLMFTPLFESNVLTVSQVIVNGPHLCRAHGFQEDVRCEYAEPDEKASGYLVIK